MPGDRFIELATAEDRHVLDVLFRHASEAVTVQERSGRLLYANDDAALLLGLESGAELVSAPLGEILADMEILDPSGNFLSWDALPGRRVMRGEPYVEEIVGYRLKGAHRAKWSRIHASPIKNDLGEVVLALNFFEDITDQIRRDEEQEVLVSVYEALGSSLDLETNVQALARALVPRVGSWCSVHLIDEVGALAPVATYSLSEEALLPDDPSDDGSISVDDDRIQARVIRSRHPEIIEEMTDTMPDELEKRMG
ncbi:MAG: PAS domain-containing protein, partial [Acidimicrobiia bacterium]